MEQDYIYTISCPDTGNVVYVGRSECWKSRAVSHVCSKEPKTNIARWIIQLRNKGKIPIIEPIDRVPRKEVRFWEQFYINIFKSWGFDLLNMVPAFTIRSHKNHTLLTLIYNMGFGLKEFCKCFSIDYDEISYQLTMEGYISYEYCNIIYKIIQDVKNNPEIRERKRLLRAKRKAIKEVTNSKIGNVC